MEKPVDTEERFRYTMSKTWKRFELTVARFFGSERNPLSGGNSKHTRSDTLHKDLYIECKYRTAGSALDTLFADTDIKAVVEHKVPIVCTKKRGQSGFLITIHSDDFAYIHEVLNAASSKEVENLQQV